MIITLFLASIRSSQRKINFVRSKNSRNEGETEYWIRPCRSTNSHYYLIKCFYFYDNYDNGHLVFILSVSVLHVCLCTACISKEGQSPIAHLQMVVSHMMGAGNLTEVLGKNRKCS